MHKPPFGKKSDVEEDAHVKITSVFHAKYRVSGEPLATKLGKSLQGGAKHYKLAQDISWRPHKM